MAGERRRARQPDPRRRREEAERLRRAKERRKTPAGREQKIDVGSVPDREPELDDAYREIVDARSDLTAESRAALLWCAAMQYAFEHQELWRLISGFWFASYGFTYPSTGSRRLGIIVYGRGFEDWTEAVQIQGEKFPIEFRGRTHYVPERLDSQPVGGTTTCWARSERAQSEEWAILTAAHVASRDLSEVRIGDLVTMQGEPPWVIVDLGPPLIDAMLLLPVEEAAQESHGAFGTFRVENLIAPWSDVRVVGGVSGAIETKVTHVTDTRGSLNPYLPIRIFLAEALRPGDSGALVTFRDAGVGIYTASMRDDAGRSEGVCQHLGQVADCMQLELHHPQ